MASRPVIPPRSSSKRLRDELDDLNHEIARKRRQLKPKGSFDSEYWETALDIVRSETARNNVRRQISTEKFKTEGGSEEAWATMEDAKQLHAELEALKLKERKFRDQLRRVKSGSGEPDSEANTVTLRRSYLELFISSSRGLGIASYGGGRENKAQSSFRASLIEAYNAQKSEIEYEDLLWCPILSRWLAKEDVTASHIFSYRHGQQTMTAIFGETQEPELFSPKNGLLISNHVEAKFESGPMLRRAFTERWQGQILRESELEKPAWSSPGKYLKRNMLLAFVDEIGHKYDHLLDGCTETGNNLEAKEEDDLLLLTAARQIGLAQEEEEDSDDENLDDDDFI
ncbi:predicted protein [Uncinocarpus reesii 1704]|uniref:HNH nuclease domain-containing protein n=1 Tax=Uncinocarpus reesii (strain UAMH 1704) TaxID=336963 RepID=C4JZL8_UNCRE|nr:uncharacterized protein UREG_07619 [Uncinocarpus reesii 1704]EEP82754.1 predicted protein [Uncinocarpus reesii 1704]